MKYTISTCISRPTYIILTCYRDELYIANTDIIFLAHNWTILKRECCTFRSTLQTNFLMLDLGAFGSNTSITISVYILKRMVYNRYH